jgi:molybdopterin/thiamine biosynthesis adenylyltransferase
MPKLFAFLANRQPAFYRFTSRGVRRYPDETPVDRQLIIPGFDQDSLSRRILVGIGLGALGGEIVSIIVKGDLAYDIRCFDPKRASLSDLSRQKLSEKDLGSHKAQAVPANLVEEAVAPLVITGYPLRFEDALEQGVDLRCDAAFVAADNNAVRRVASSYFRQEGIPLIVAGLSPGADTGYVFVQEGDGPCWGCLFPDRVDDATAYECVPACGDIAKAVAAVAAYAYTTLFSRRARDWNYYELNLSGPNASRTCWIPRRSRCPLCG